MVSLLLTFNKYTVPGVLSLHFYVSIYNQLEKSEHWKENHRGKTNYFTGKYATS